MKSCPHCGMALPDEASFCPGCARSVIVRETVRRPRRVPARVLYVLLAVLAAALLAALVWHFVPKTYDDGTAQALYSLKGRTYQLCIAWADTPTEPFSDRYTPMTLNDNGRYPALLYVNHADSGENAADEFLPQVESVTAEFEDLSFNKDLDKDMRLSCTPPVRRTDYVPEAAQLTFVDFCLWTSGDYEAQLVFTVTMKNHDVIRVRQTHHFHATKTYTYTPEDASMNTAEEVQALLEEIARTVEDDAEVNINLPAVTYDEGLALDRRAVNLYGSADAAGTRTTFTAPIRLAYPGGVISYFEGIDFVGTGGTGVSAASRLHLTSCRFSGWETAALCEETAWVNADQCVFSDNGVGLYIRNTESNISDSRYEYNVFQDNGTAVLLERVGVDISLKFPGTVFSGNGADIDNRCGQELELDQTIFQ